MLSKVNMHKWVKTLKLPHRVEAQVLSYLRYAKTPQDFEDRVRGLAERLENHFRKLHENYRSNWHSTECECDECMRLDKERW